MVRPPVSINASARPAVHDLVAIARELAETYFPDAPPVTIGWARARQSPRRGRMRSLRLGVYRYDVRAIQVHPALDQDWVPRYFVAWVVFHELLHHVTPARPSPRGLSHHGADFRRGEVAFRDRELALEWERRNVRRLVASRDA